MRSLQEESDTAKDLKDMLVALNFEKPPDDITAEKLFSRLEAKLSEVLKTAPRELVGEPLVTNEFTEREWKDLELVQQELHDEYRMRRDMLLKRLDVTVQSFLVSTSVLLSTKNDRTTRIEKRVICALVHSGRTE